MLLNPDGQLLAKLIEIFSNPIAYLVTVEVKVNFWVIGISQISPGIVVLAGGQNSGFSQCEGVSQLEVAIRALVR